MSTMTDLNTNCTEAKATTVTPEVIKEAMEKLAEEGRKPAMHLPWTKLPLWIEYYYGYKPWSKESKEIVAEARSKGYIVGGLTS